MYHPFLILLNLLTRYAVDMHKVHTDYLNDLNEAQKQAVINSDGPALVIAGAGAGKTRVLTYRIIHLINNGVPPGRILALTFTNKAAREMRERIMRIASPEIARYLWMGTFHSIFAKILRIEDRKSVV